MQFIITHLCNIIILLIYIVKQKGSKCKTNSKKINNLQRKINEYKLINQQYCIIIQWKTKMSIKLRGDKTWQKKKK